MSTHADKSLEQLAAETRSGVRRAELGGESIRLAPLAAGDLDSHFGLVRVVADRAYALLFRDKLRPMHDRELWAFAWIVAAKFHSRHDAARGRFSTFLLRYGPSWVARMWRAKDGGMPASIAHGNLMVSRGRVRRARGSDEEREVECIDRSLSPLDAMIAKEEREAVVRDAAQVMEMLSEAEMFGLQARGVTQRKIAETIHLTRDQVCRRMKWSRRELAEDEPCP